MKNSSINAVHQRYLLVAALIGLGFLWSGTAYMMQAFRLLSFLDGGTVNLLVCGLYYVCQAAGVGIVAILFAKRSAVAGGRALPFYISIVKRSSLQTYYYLQRCKGEGNLRRF